MTAGPTGKESKDGRLSLPCEEGNPGKESKDGRFSLPCEEGKGEYLSWC